MNTKHTSGPWEVDGSSICQAQGDRRVAWLTIPEAGKKDEWQANSRLIAAAPDLLTHLVRTISQFNALENNLSGADLLVIDAAQSAIAKATGEDVP